MGRRTKRSIALSIRRRKEEALRLERKRELAASINLAFAAAVGDRSLIRMKQNGAASESLSTNFIETNPAGGYQNPSLPGSSNQSDETFQAPMFEEVILKASPRLSPIHSENRLLPPLMSPEKLYQENSCAEVAPSRRVINFEHFARELMKLGEHPYHCHNGRYQLVQEITRDLESDFVYVCFKCKNECTISTDPEPESINDAFICGGVTMGIAYAQLQEVLTTADLPKMSEVNYKIKESSVHLNFENLETPDLIYSVKEEPESDV